MIIVLGARISQKPWAKARTLHRPEHVHGRVGPACHVLLLQTMTFEMTAERVRLDKHRPCLRCWRDVETFWDQLRGAGREVTS